jgi:hypothetical protein
MWFTAHLGPLPRPPFVGDAPPPARVYCGEIPWAHCHPQRVRAYWSANRRRYVRPFMVPATTAWPPFSTATC